MPERKYTQPNSNYRYGFNGKERDNEIKGDGNQVDYGMRIYDSRMGRFLSVDPLTDEYPELTPYQFASNRPIDGVDLDGEEWLPAIKWLETKLFGSNHIEKTESGFVKRGTDLVNGIIHLVKVAVKNPPNLNTATGGISYAKLDPNSLQKSKQMLEEMGKALVDDYADLSNRASKGDEDAIGGLMFEAAMLIVPIPGAAESKGFGAAAKAATNVEKLLYLSEKTIARELTESSIELVDQGLIKSGWTKTLVKESENAIQHTVYSKTSKSGRVYTLDYHPGGGQKGGAYWKGTFRKPAKAGYTNKEIDLFRVGKDLKLQGRKIKAPIYNNGQKVGGSTNVKKALKT